MFKYIIIPVLTSSPPPLSKSPFVLFLPLVQVWARAAHSRCGRCQLPRVATTSAWAITAWGGPAVARRSSLLKVSRVVRAPDSRHRHTSIDASFLLEYLADKIHVLFCYHSAQLYWICPTRHHVVQHRHCPMSANCEIINDLNEL